MPVITEEDEGSNVFAQDFTELLGLPDIAFAGSNDALIDSTVAGEPLPPVCPSHPEQSEYDDPPSTVTSFLILTSHSCLCHGFMGDWDLPAPSNDPYVSLEEPDYAKFENVGHAFLV